MRKNSIELDEIIDKEFKILDKGFIKIIDYMGNDSSIAEMARCSYAKGTKTISDDESLIRYLMRNDHTSPFEACELKFHIKLPIMVARQLFRHRTFSINENSLRFSEATNDKIETFPNEWRLQSKDNKQGSSGLLDLENGKMLSKKEKELHNFIESVYNERLNLGVSREQARKDLPLSNYTEAYMKIDLHNLLHMLKLRMDDHAQIEIRHYSNFLGEQIVKRWVPITWKAFVDYKLNAITFSKQEQIILKKIIDLNKLEEYNSELSNREIREFSEKISRILTEI